MLVVTVVGARPQFVKAAAVSRAFEQASYLEDGLPRLEEKILHTGQHYDASMSDVFFEELGIPAPAYNLGVGSGTHAKQTAAMMQAMEASFLELKPACVLVYGDTNSTLAAGLVAAKLQIPIAHVEAGLRSFNRKMPEEINRVLVDHVSQFLFCPTKASVDNLKREGIVRGVEAVGDVMCDSVSLFGSLARDNLDLLRLIDVSSKNYILATVHRAESTDDEVTLKNVVSALKGASKLYPVVWPVHPRTRLALEKAGLLQSLETEPEMRLIEPAGFLDMMTLEHHAKLVMTDSGGVQKEAYFHRVPCVTLRTETEWVELVEAGWNYVTGLSEQGILAAVEEMLKRDNSGQLKYDPNLYGDGSASSRIVASLRRQLAR